jgi:Reverse transcriptase (RNA-dependent DNA polymerase)
MAYTDNKNWVVVRRTDTLKDRKVLPAVWEMRRNRDIATRKVTKWKARLNLHGGKQQKGIDYWETYAPVASWASIRLIMYLAVLKSWLIMYLVVLKSWYTRQLDFVLAFSQAPVETVLYMEIPAGFDTNGDSKDYAHNLVHSLYRDGSRLVE